MSARVELQPRRGWVAASGAIAVSYALLALLGPSWVAAGLALGSAFIARKANVTRLVLDGRTLVLIRPPVPTKTMTISTDTTWRRARNTWGGLYVPKELLVENSGGSIRVAIWFWQDLAPLEDRLRSLVSDQLLPE
jgi:hypothetical protein